MKWKSLLCILLLSLVAPRVTAAAETDDKAQWFRDAKFGMFVHWGLYAQAGGVWEGKKYYGIGEWLMNRAKIKTKDYETLAAQFNPVKFNADEWVRVAKDAGMKYIVITSKHHDGFAMFGSKASPYNIVDATPFKRDPLKELADACRREGIRLGFYYSQYQDWHEPGGGGNSWEFPDSAEKFDEYYETKCKPQVREILSGYGSLGIIWFDTPGRMTAQQSGELVDLVHSLQPQCLVSSRVGNDAGDYLDLGDGEMPTEVIDKPWEAPFTHNDSWGYVWYDQNWKGPTELVRRLVAINAKGGNFLLNVGPQADGALPEASVRVFKTVGEWVRKNAEAIYGSTHSPFPELTWGQCTAKPGALYLHVFSWPEDGSLRVPGLHADVRKVTLLDSGKRLKYTWQGNDLLVRLPEKMPDPMATVIKLQYRGDLSVDPLRTLMEGYATTFESTEAKITGQASIKKHSWMEEFGDWKHAHVVEGWVAPRDSAVWEFCSVTPGQYWVELTYSFPSNSAKREGLIVLNDRESELRDAADRVIRFSISLIIASA